MWYSRSSAMRKGNLWIGTDRGLTSYRDGRFAPVGAHGAPFEARVTTPRSCP